VAELADAQVSEACDGDIVEVQVLSSAPMRIFEAAGPKKYGLAAFNFCNNGAQYFERPKKICHVFS
jgi:hypothetical protein